MILHCMGLSSWILVPVVQDLAQFKFNLIYAINCRCLVLHVSFRKLIYVKDQSQGSTYFRIILFCVNFFFSYPGGEKIRMSEYVESGIRWGIILLWSF
jgi:hypothetical protein